MSVQPVERPTAPRLTSAARGQYRSVKLARVVTHPAHLERYRSIAQVGQRHTGQAHVDRAAFHVQAVLGDSAAARLAQRRIRRRAAIAGNHFERTRAADERLNLVQQIEEPRIIAPISPL